MPGRRKAVLPLLERTSELPARARARRLGGRPAGDEQPPPPLRGRRAATTLGLVWLLCLAGTVGALVALRYVGHGVVLEQSLAAALGVLLALGLAVRSGGRWLPATVIALAVSAAAVLSRSPTLLAGAALGTAVLAACLAILSTTPAPTFRRAVLEVGLAEVLATAGAVGVAGFRVDLDPSRFGYTALGLSLAASVVLVHRLGGGLRGLGRSGMVLFGAVLALLVVALAYTAALIHWGSPQLRLEIDSTRTWLRDHLGGVPQPIEVLLGIPALVWGVTMRDRRRQGWWVCAFGATATGTATTRLIQDHASTLDTLLGTAYSLALGLVVGYAVIRLGRLLGEAPGRRAARVDAATHRPEPPRLQPLH